LLLGEPSLGLSLAQDTPDDNSLRVFLHLIEDTIVVNAHSVRRNDHADQTLDPCPALDGWVHGQHPLALIGDTCGIGRPQRSELIKRFDRILEVIRHLKIIPGGVGTFNREEPIEPNRKRQHGVPEVMASVS
jgi:hypothetical protein